jgi:2-polyprenyl-3-methyl-5-hydroxy-6-metoxy-1,4-benzoquinol methylase
MIHLINDFMHEDATVERHYVPRRLFKIAEDMKYPETEHGVLTSSIEPDKGRYDGICIWHLAYVKHKFEILKKYKNHLAKSEMHSKDFLRTWYLSHLLGTYPAREVDLTKFPDVLARKFDVKDLAERIYFARRAQLEAKHFIDAANWKDHFKPKKVLDVGCGMGLRMYAMKTYGLDVEGIEISRFAINSNLFGLADKMVCIDVSLPDLQMGAYQYDLVIAYDVLEHIEPDRLDQTIENIKKMATKNILCSIPFVGDPNLEADKTHKIKQTKEWWENKFKEHGLKILEVPRHFAYRPQQILCTV